MALTLSLLIKALSTAGYAVYTGATFTADSIDNINCISYESIRLKNRCTEIVEDLQQINIKLLITGRGHRLIQTVTNCLTWACKYDKKCKCKKFLFSNSYREKFDSCHLELTNNFYDLAISVFLTHYFPNIQTQLDGSTILRIANKNDQNELCETIENDN
jgi:hypothetical protein